MTTGNMRDIRQAKFFWIDNAFLDDERIGHKEIAVYATLCRFLNQDTGYCFPSYATLSKKTGLSRSSVIRVINYLIEIGYVSKEIRQTETGNQSNLYFINDVNSIPSVPVTPPSVEDVLPSVSDTPPLVSEVHPNNTNLKNTNLIINSPHESAGNTDYSSEFDQFWEVYPRKVGKKKAYEAFCKVMKQKNVSIDSVVNGVLKYTKSLEKNKTEKKFIKHPTTYINGEHWNDDEDEVNKVKSNIGERSYQTNIYQSDSVESDLDGSIFLD